MTISWKICLTILALGSCACVSGPLPSSGQALRTQLAGRWRSVACRAVPQGGDEPLYLSRAFRFSEAQWELRLTTHADPQCEQPVMQIRVAGGYDIEGESAVAPGAFEVTFERDEVAITPLAPAGVVPLEQQGCGDGPWELGHEQSVAQGCLFLPPIDSCPAEYDLVRLEPPRLMFGLRAASLCRPEDRPQAIDADNPMVRDRR